MPKEEEKRKKNIELVSLLASHIDSDMEYGNFIQFTPLRNKITLTDGNHPHKDSVTTKMEEAEVWKNIINKIDFIKDGDKLKGILKIHDKTNETEKQLSNDINLIKDRLDNIEKQNDKIIKLIKKDNMGSIK